MCDVSVLDGTQKLASAKLINHVYEYWNKKRQKLGKALIRRFQPPTSINDTSPHSTFRPREKEEKRMRRTRMKDKDAHKNLKQFHADFRRAKELLESLVKREKAKKALLQLDFCLKFAKDIKDIPPTVLKQQEEFFKDWHRDRDKAKQSSTKKIAVAVEAADDEPAAANVAGGRPRGAASRPAPTVEAEPIVQVEEGDDRARRLEGIKRCFQSLMRKWDGGIDSPGASLLPLAESSSGTSRLIGVGAALISGCVLFRQEKTDWSVRCIESDPSFRCRDGLHMRGRGRIGRGGRLIFDVCSRHASAAPTPPADSHFMDEADGESTPSSSFGAGLCPRDSDVIRTKRKREWLEAARCAPGPDARKFGPSYIDALWDEMRASDRSDSAVGGAQSRGCWNFGTGAKSSYLDP
jgi:transposase-like protein